MGSILSLYFSKKKRDMRVAWKKAKAAKSCYLFVLPYAVLFTLVIIVRL